MGRGLFAVFRDDAAVAGPSNALKLDSATLTNKASSRRQDGLNPLAATRRGLGTREKENENPFGAPSLGKAALKKGDGALKVAKFGDGSCAPVRRGLGASIRVAAQATKPSANGICTGSLRTRVLPDLPPLPADFEAIDAVAVINRDGASDILPTFEVTIGETQSTESSPRGSCDRSYASTTDSGYAQSPRPRTRTRSPTATDSLVHASEAVDDAESDMSLVKEEREISTAEANRRARALTESPLAEVTQAFTGLGGFSAASMSPSPAAPPPFARSALVHPAQYRPSLLRHPSSPTRKTASSAAAGLRVTRPPPTGTMRKIKPGQTVASAPKAAPKRTMRL